MALVLNHNYTSSYYLANSSDNPVTVTGDIDAATGDGLFGAVGIAFTITNLGTIKAPADGYGIYIDSGKITNGSKTAVHALVEGYDRGIYTAGTASVTNYATIAGTGATAEGIHLLGGTVVNQAHGLISGQGGAVYVATTGVVKNAGTLHGTGSDVFNDGGVWLGGGTVTNTGTIISNQSYGAGIGDGGGTVTNSGSIGGLVGVSVGNVGVTTGGGGVYNKASGRITGYDGVTTTHAGFKVINAGYIAGTKIITVDGIRLGDGVFLDAGGVVINQTGGTLTGVSDGVRAANGTASVTNSGVIEGIGSASYGISLLDGGTVVNKSSGSTAPLILGETGIALGGPGGKITNFGTVTGSGGTTAGIVVSGSAGATSIITNSGSISGDFGVYAAPTGTGWVTLTNAGTITGTGGSAVQFGAGNDTLVVDAGAVFNGQVLGGLGTDTVEFKSAGTISFAEFSGFETVTLANGGPNTLVLADANFAGVTGNKITVKGGSGGNTIDASGVTGAHQVVLDGGAGVDVLIAGEHETMTGGAGADTFEFTTPGTLAAPDTNTITDFTHSTDKIAFSDAGFSLGLAGASSTPQALPSALFTSNSTGSFTTADQRFAYNTTTGALSYDSQGNTAGSTVQLVATLDNHPKLTASDLFFVS